MDTVRDCNTCRHHVQGRSIDDAPSVCWSCIGLQGQTKVDLPYWSSKEGLVTVDTSKPKACNTDGKAAPVELRIRKGYLGRQVGGNHYRDMAIQPIEFALANKLDFFQLNIVKYITRRKENKRVEDLKKAQHYLGMYIEAVEAGRME